MPSVPKPSTDATVDTATLELLAQWRKEDATDDPERVRAAQSELEEFKKAMNDHRTDAGERILYP